MALKKVSNESEATEIIELSIADIDLLTRAFDVITEACNQLQNPTVKSEQPPRIMIN